MAKKIIYCTLDTETVGGTTKNCEPYHMAGLIHDRKGEVIAGFNYIVAEHYHKIPTDSYAKKNWHKYLQFLREGVVTVVATEEEAINAIDNICNYYGVSCMLAYNSGFDFGKTSCRKLIENRNFIDLWLMALETLAQQKQYLAFCRENDYYTGTKTNKKNVKTSAEIMYKFMTQNKDFEEEHTALEDAKIELEIFLRCLSTHKKFSQNVHCFNHPDRFQYFQKF